MKDLKLDCNSSIEETDVNEKLEYINEIEELIWNINEQNYYQSRQKLANIIRDHKNIVVWVLKCIDYISMKREKQYRQLVELYIYISRGFSININVKNQDFAVLLNYYGLIYEIEENSRKPQEILNIVPPQTVYHAIVWDNIQQMYLYYTAHFGPNTKYIDRNEKPIDLIDLSIKYNSINCFKFLILNYAKLTTDSVKYSIASGNFEIMKILEQKGGDFSFNLTTAVENHRNDIADWLINNYKCEQISVPQCLSCFNLKSSLFLIENGFDVNEKYIIKKVHSLSYTIHYILIRQFIISLIRKLI